MGGQVRGYTARGIDPRTTSERHDADAQGTASTPRFGCGHRCMSKKLTEVGATLVSYWRSIVQGVVCCFSDTTKKQKNKTTKQKNKICSTGRQNLPGGRFYSSIQHSLCLPGGWKDDWLKIFSRGLRAHEVYRTNSPVFTVSSVLLKCLLRNYFGDCYMHLHATNRVERH